MTLQFTYLPSLIFNSFTTHILSEYWVLIEQLGSEVRLVTDYGKRQLVGWTTIFGFFDEVLVAFNRLVHFIIKVIQQGCYS